jgi:cell division protease FtsH
MLLSRSQLLARIITTLGGRVTEQVVFGDPEVTTGASNDLQQVTNIARQMVTRYGMSNIGPIALEDDNNEQMFLGVNIMKQLQIELIMKFVKSSIIVNKLQLKLF